MRARIGAEPLVLLVVSLLYELGALFNLSEPYFLPEWDGGNDIFLEVVVRIKWAIVYKSIKHLASCLEHDISNNNADTC